MSHPSVLGIHEIQQPILLDLANEKFVLKQSKWTKQRGAAFISFFVCCLFSLILLIAVTDKDGAATDVLGISFQLKGATAYIPALLSALFAAICWLNVRRHQNICDKGVLIQADIVACERTTVNEGWGSQIQFKFTSPDGKVIEKSEDCPREARTFEGAHHIQVLFLDEYSFYAL